MLLMDIPLQGLSSQSWNAVSISSVSLAPFLDSSDALPERGAAAAALHLTATCGQTPAGASLTSARCTAQQLTAATAWLLQPDQHWVAYGPLRAAL